VALDNAAPGFIGGASATCVQGVWVLDEVTCVELIDARCGPAVGSSSAAAPGEGLCAAGAASAVAGTGPFTWTCAGQGGGVDAACESDRGCEGAPLTWGAGCGGSVGEAAHGYGAALANGAVGWVGSATAACSQGAWATSDEVCVEIIVAQCGAASGTSVDGAPSADLCAAGAASAVAGTGPYTWTCAGQGGGTDASCAADEACDAGVVSWGGSCSAGVARAGHAFAGVIANSAAGYVGVADVTCAQGAWSATGSCVEIIDALCGAAAGESFADAPATALCAAGTPGVVSGTGPYTWSCNGHGGGSDASCSANKSCAAGSVGWGSCSASVSLQSHAFTGAVTNTTSGYTGSATASCSQGTWSASGTCTQIINATCGTAHNGSFTSQPATNLCGAGTPTAVSGTGPYTWSCNGQGGGSNASCSANKSCAVQTLSWLTNCSASQSAQAHGYSATLSNTAASYSGSATATCSQGIWSTSSPTCVATGCTPGTQQWCGTCHCGTRVQICQANGTWGSCQNGSDCQQPGTECF